MKLSKHSNFQSVYDSLADPNNPMWDHLVMKLEELADKPQLMTIRNRLENGTLNFGKDIHEVNVPERHFKSWHMPAGDKRFYQGMTNNKGEKDGRGIMIGLAVTLATFRNNIQHGYT